MHLSLPPPLLCDYVNSLLRQYLPDTLTGLIELSSVDQALQRINHSHSHINRKYYQLSNVPIFNHLNADHFAAFLWFLGDSIFCKIEDEAIPLKLCYLNKIMHGLDLFYSVQMPDIFMLVHPVGSVIGNAKFGNYLMVYQNCSIGAVDIDYPTFGEGVVLYSKSSVLGRSHIGDNVLVGANTLLVNTDVCANSTVVGQHPNLRSWGYTGSVISDKFGLF